jgi:hypothetical protein
MTPVCSVRERPLFQQLVDALMATSAVVLWLGVRAAAAVCVIAAHVWVTQTTDAISTDQQNSFDDALVAVSVIEMVIEREMQPDFA